MKKAIIPPHAGIAVKLTPKALIDAFAIVQEQFTAFEATAEKIVLVRAEPYKTFDYFVLCQTIKWNLAYLVLTKQKAANQNALVSLYFIIGSRHRSV